MTIDNLKQVAFYVERGADILGDNEDNEIIAIKKILYAATLLLLERAIREQINARIACPTPHPIA